ncbi:hypothetical protein [Congregibacter sp.]|uniref:hypothetical protein n=1 Tax=Congregibacter sp. TaxID=2744308 RepID=UPI003F6B5350
MSYPRPDVRLVQSWQATVEVLQENTASQHSVLRMAYPTSSEIIAAAPHTNNSLSVGQRDNRDGSHYCDEVLRQRRTLSVQGAGAALSQYPRCADGSP